MSKKLTPVEDAFAAFEFCQWADAVAKSDGVPLVGPDQRRLIAAAAAELRRHYTEAAERQRLARESGRQGGLVGGRPPAKKPKPSTIRSRKSRARKRAERQGGDE